MGQWGGRKLPAGRRILAAGERRRRRGRAAGSLRFPGEPELAFPWSSVSSCCLRFVATQGQGARSVPRGGRGRKGSRSIAARPRPAVGSGRNGYKTRGTTSALVKAQPYAAAGIPRLHTSHCVKRAASATGGRLPLGEVEPRVEAGHFTPPEEVHFRCPRTLSISRRAWPPWRRPASRDLQPTALMPGRNFTIREATDLRVGGAVPESGGDQVPWRSGTSRNWRSQGSMEAGHFPKHDASGFHG